MSPGAPGGGDNGVMGWEREESAYRSYGPDLMRLATALVGRSDAEDLVSITLSSLLQSGRQNGAVLRRCASVLARPPDSLRSRSGRWAEADDMRAYAMGAVTRQASSLHRSSGRRRRREERIAVPLAVSDQAGGDPVLWQAVLSLPVRQRAVLYLAYWEDMSPTAIGHILGISDGAVRRHLARARSSMRRSLS